MYPGIRIYAAASWGMVVVGVIHLIGHFAGRPSDPVAMSTFGTMDGYRLAFPLGMAPSLLDVFRSLSLTMSILLASLGALNVVAIRHGGASRSLMLRLAGVTAFGVAAVVGLEAFYRVFPPLILLSVVEVMLILALIRLAGGRT